MPHIGKLIPLADYKGQVLKLSNADKAEISRLQKRILNNQQKLEYLENELNMPGIDQVQKINLRLRISRTTALINDINNFIREIKIDRFNKQKLNVVV